MASPHFPAVLPMNTIAARSPNSLTSPPVFVLLFGDEAARTPRSRPRRYSRATRKDDVRLSLIVRSHCAVDMSLSGTSADRNTPWLITAISTSPHSAPAFPVEQEKSDRACSSCERSACAVRRRSEWWLIPGSAASWVRATLLER